MQLYMETVQDLLDPANNNIAIVENPKSGNVSLPGASLVEVRDQHSFLELLQLGEAHQFAAYTKLNTESSRSHAILIVNIRRSLQASNGNSHVTKSLKPPVVRKGKLVVVDLARSERINKSDSRCQYLATEESNRPYIVESGGLNSLLMLLKNTEAETIQRVSIGAIVNLAMNNETNYKMIIDQGVIGLLSSVAATAQKSQTLKMVAGAIANFCSNDKLQRKLRCEGGITALLRMMRCQHHEVLEQVARGITNFAKCESRTSTRRIKRGKSILIKGGALSWIVQNAKNETSLAIRQHMEVALCHLGKREANAKEMVKDGAIWVLVRISRDCSREDIRSLAYRTLVSSPTFLTELISFLSNSVVNSTSNLIET